MQIGFFSAMHLGNVTPKDIQRAIRKSPNFWQALRVLGLVQNGGNHKLLKAWVSNNNLDTSHFKVNRYKRAGRPLAEIFVNNRERRIGSGYLRSLILAHGLLPYKCAVCGRKPRWRGKPLTLTLDHINGLRYDNRLENLRFVCPNCNAQLDTTGGSNRVRYLRGKGE
jgi:5-methylcytosine-specific restriction endonuclease McrA